MNDITIICTDTVIEPLLADYYTGHLPSEDEQRVRDHLTVCRACRQTIRMMGLISGKLEDFTFVEEQQHYSPQLLAQYFQSPGSIDPNQFKSIEAHLKQCSDCSADLEFLQNSREILVGTYISKESLSLWSRLSKSVVNWFTEPK